MVNVFISHCEEDSQVAVQMAETLEEHGYSTWFYERDTLPGISYLLQCHEAIRDSDSFLLLISSDSLVSHEVTKEVQQAHQRNQRFLPVLLGLSCAEFQSRQPEWHAALGTVASIEFRGEVRSIVERVVQTLERWEVRPPPAHPSQPPRPRPSPGLPDRPPNKIWASDARQIDIHDLKRVVFKNRIIEEFLQGRTKHFLSANKGLGKTLLLTYKRCLLTETYQQPGQGKTHAQVQFVPEGRPYLDFMSDLRWLRKTHERFLSGLGNTKRLWGLALRVSALSHHPSLFSKDDAEELARFPKPLARWLRGGEVEPTVVFKEVLGCSIREINRVIDETENFLEHKLRQIHSGMFFFIDKVDQGIRNLPRSGWVHVQAGLIEGAWDVMSANPHVKVFASIRQEAFSNYHSDIKTNLYGATTILQYSERDLCQLLDQLTLCYEGKTFKEFIKLNSVRHPHRACPEDSFRYMQRHTLGRPRDLVIISSELSGKQNSLTEPLYRRLVNVTGAAVLVSNVFDEMRVFLDSLHDQPEQLRFFSLLPYNILRREEAINVWCKFNGVGPECAEVYDVDSEHFYHPFWELYSAGLVGVVVKEPDRRTAVQKFKQPHEMIPDSQSALPEADFYLVHPALDEFIRNHRQAGDYRVFQHVIVGHDCVWEDYFGTLCNVERALFDVDDEDLRELTCCVLKEATVLLSAGRREDVPTVMEGSRDWVRLMEQLARRNYDDLYLWLEELIAGSQSKSPSKS